MGTPMSVTDAITKASEHLQAGDYEAATAHAKYAGIMQGLHLDAKHGELLDKLDPVLEQGVALLGAAIAEEAPEVGSAPAAGAIVPEP